METGAITPIQWRGDHLEVLDQRKLPGSVVYVRLDNAAQVGDAIRGMVVRGAPAIGIAAAYGVVLAALEADSRGLTGDQWLGAVSAAGQLLACARPTAVNLAWAVRRMLDDAAQASANTRVDTSANTSANTSALADLADRIFAEDLACNRALARLGAAMLPEGAHVLTHCNAGALATAGLGTALGIIRQANQEGRLAGVFATETRPLLQGARLTAWELAQEGIPVTLLADGAAAWLLRSKRVDAVIVGADRVAANGDVANKIGTLGLATAARAQNVPFYVACPISTLDVETATGGDILIEERDPREVTHVHGRRLAPRGVRVYNPAFDVTPAGMVTAIITEHAVLGPPYEAAITAVLERRSSLAVTRGA